MPALDGRDRLCQRSRVLGPGRPVGDVVVAVLAVEPVDVAVEMLGEDRRCTMHRNVDRPLRAHRRPAERDEPGVLFHSPSCRETRVAEDARRSPPPAASPFPGRAQAIRFGVPAKPPSQVWSPGTQSTRRSVPSRPGVGNPTLHLPRAHLKTASNNALFDMSAAPSSPPTGDSYRSKDRVPRSRWLTNHSHPPRPRPIRRRVGTHPAGTAN